MKKTICILLACLLMTLTLEACSKDTPTAGKSDPTPSSSSTVGKPTDPEPSTPAPTDPVPTDPEPSDPKPTDPAHICQSASADYLMDKDDHWQFCECGQVLNSTPHILENGTCTVCSAEIITDDYTGLTFLYLYNDYGDAILCQYYDSDGELLLTETYAYTYSEQGNILSQKHYTNSILTEETTLDIWGNVLSMKEYDEEGKVISSVIYELVCDNYGNILSEKHITNDVLTYEGSYYKDEDGQIWLMSDIYYLEDGSKEQSSYNEFCQPLTRTLYDAQGNIIDTYEYQYQYTADGLITDLRCTLNGKVLYLEKYTLVNNFGDSYSYLSQCTEYRPDGSYSTTTYDEYGSTLTYTCFDAAGNPLDYSPKFNATLCAPLLGTWTGTLTMDGSMLDMDGLDVSLNATITLTFYADGKMLAVMDQDEEAYRQFMIQFTTDIILAMYGGEMSAEDLDAFFKAEYGMGLEEYVKSYVDSMDLNEQLHQKWEGVYFVENNILYSGDSWNTFMDASAFLLEDNKLTLTDAESDITLVLTKDDTQRPIDPPADLKAHEKFDATACASLFGVWEYSQTMSTQDMGYQLEKDLTVTMTVRITFTENGIQVMQMIADQQAYYNFRLAIYVENIYREMTASGKTRQEVDAYYAAQGTTVQQAAADMLGPADELLPDDGYFFYYVENGVLYYGRSTDYTTQMRITIQDNTLTFHGEEGAEDIILTKKR